MEFQYNFGYVDDGLNSQCSYLDQLPKEAIHAIEALHTANTIAITQRKKKYLSPSTKGGAASNAKPRTPSQRNLKDTRIALQEKAK